MYVTSVPRAAGLALAVVLMSVAFGAVLAWSLDGRTGASPPARLTTWRPVAQDDAREAAEEAQFFASLRAERTAQRIEALRAYNDRAQWYAAVRGPTFEQILVFFNVLLSDAPHQAEPAAFTASLAPAAGAAVVPAPAALAPVAPSVPPPPAAPQQLRAEPRPTSTPAPPPPPPPPAAASDVWTDAAFTRDVWSGVNARRTQAGLAPVAEEPRLTRAAADYAVLMSETDWFSHTGPDGSSFVERIVAAGFPFEGSVGEILAMGTNGWPAADVVQAWIDSPPHREQMLNGNYRLAGIGCAFTREDGALVVRCAMEFAA